MEEWRATSYPNYEVSDLGRVRSWAVVGRSGGRALRPRILRAGVNTNGYLLVVCGKGTRTVHSLVAKAFLGTRPTGYDIRHKDDNKRNPRLDNLHYGTRSQNIMDSVQRGRWKHWKKLTPDEVRKIRASSSFHRVLAKQFGVSLTTISEVRSGKTWRHAAS